MASQTDIQGALAAAGIIQTINQQYPQFAGLFQAVPELRPLLIEAATGQIASTDILAEKLHNTNWWKTTPQSAREWQVQQVIDPAQSAQNFNATASQYYTLAAKEGISIPLAVMNNLVHEGISNQWSQQQVQDAIIGQARWNDKRTGDLDATTNQLKSVAGNYGLTIGDPALFDWAKQIQEGKNTNEGFQAYATQQAKSMFPGIASYLDQGLTVRQFADPYIQMAASTLGIDPNTVSLQDQKWRAPLQQKDPKTHQFTPMALQDWQSELMTNPTYGWDGTAGARNAATTMIQQVGQMFGRVA